MDEEQKTKLLLMEIRSISNHLMETYKAEDALNIAISILVTLTQNLEAEDKAHFISHLYTIVDDIKYDELDAEKVALH